MKTRVNTSTNWTAEFPVYETLPGWTAPTAGRQRYDDLPREARAYVARLEEITGVPAAIVSTGSIGR